MRTGVLFSGGKDSCLALHKAVESGKKIDCLLSLMPENKDSFMFHKPDLKLLKKQAEMLDLQLIIQKTKGKQDEEVGDLRKLIEKSKVDVLVIGGIASNYQKRRIEDICNQFKLKLIAPLWGYEGGKLWQELLENNFVLIITKVSCEGLGKEWIGRMINKENFQELKSLAKRYKFNLSGEGGEFETLVLDCPLFNKKLEITKGKVVWERNSGYYVVEEIRVLNKEKEA